MSFLKENGAAAVLIAAIFMTLGFMLGKCCSHPRGCHKGASGCHKGHDGCGHHGDKKHKDCGIWVSDHGHCDELIIVDALMEEGFVGDTTLSIPGGEIVITVGEDGEVNVEADIEELLESHGESVHELHKEVRIIKTTEEH